MPEKRAVPQRDVWEQWDWVWHVSAYAFFGLTVAVFLGNAPAGGLLPGFLILAALLAVWYIPFVANPVTRWWNNPALCGLHFLLGWALWGGLIALDAVALLLAGMFYPMIFTRLRLLWAVAAALVQTFLICALFVIRHAPEDWFPASIVGLGILAGAVLLGAFIAALASQSSKRQRLLEEFTRTRAELLKAEREMGVLAERQRLAREIHDTLAQQFASIIMHLSAARLGDPVAAPASLRQAEQAAREGLEEARRIVWDPYPGETLSASLVEDLEVAAARFSVESAVAAELAVTGNPRPLDSSVEFALLRICREALQNVNKHARARKVTVTLSYMPGAVALDVADDGRGFDPGRSGRGFGLKSMRERAEELGGAFTVESRPGSGAKIAVSVPAGDSQ
ncbi:MAG: sensor histidine kinase [Anaerolineales bacterium]|nr:sensor histidine kinase [Anaerolineales bacterium]